VLLTARFPPHEEVLNILTVDAAICVDIASGFAIGPGEEEGFDILSIDAAIAVEVADAQCKVGSVAGRTATGVRNNAVVLISICSHRGRQGIRAAGGT
jgi:hypothetical protein